MRLALDLSTVSTGWCLGEREADLEFGTFTPRPKDILEKRMSFIVQEVSELCFCFGVSSLLIEEVHSRRNAKTARALDGLVGAVRCALYSSYDLVAVMANRKTVLKDLGVGGNADKEAVIRMLKLRGFKVKNDDEADAVALWLSRSYV